MAFPTIKVHQASSPTTFNTVLFNWKEDMVAAGWRVLGSGNTTISFNSPGSGSGSGSGGIYDVWVTDADIVRSSGGNDASWIRFGTPLDAQHQREYLLSLDSTSGTDTEFHIMKWWRSLDSDGFDRDESPDTPPNADDHLAPGQDLPADPDNDIGGITGRYIHGDAAGQTFWALGDVAEDYDFLFWTMRDAKTIFGAFGQCTITNTNPAWGTDADPCVYICGFRDADTYTDSWAEPILTGQLHNIAANSAGATQESFTVSTPAFNDNGGCYASVNFGSGTAFSGTYGVAMTANMLNLDNDFIKRDPETGHLVMSSIEWRAPFNDIEFNKGVSTGGLIKYPGISIADPAHLTEVFQTPTNSERKLVVYKVALPWPTTTDFTQF